MKIYYEDSMPYAAEFFTELGDCQVFSHKTVNAEQLADADVLLVRSTTKVNEALIGGSPKLKFVGTATAGTNHVDTAYLTRRQIQFSSAAGCNAVAVAEYVLSCLMVMATQPDWQLQQKTVGIVGAGHVGSALQARLETLGIAYKLCDPPLAEAGDPRDFVSLDDIMLCDIITLHVPLVKSGPHATLKMFDAARLAQLSEQQLLINACRGEVLDNAAALKLFEQGKKLNLVLDVWENEPDISLALMSRVALATAHIAGHTIEGKARGTEMLYQALCQFSGQPQQQSLNQYLPVEDKIRCLDEQLTNWQNIRQLILSVYDISADSQQFKTSVKGPEQFGYIRKNYPIRREFSAIKVNTGNFSQSKALYALGFSEG